MPGRSPRRRILDLDQVDEAMQKIAADYERRGIRMPPFDLGPCPVPSCTARARRGWRIREDRGLERENKVYVCDEHVKALLEDRLVVDGCAPDELVWIAGEREVAAWRAAPGELQ